uniref:Uncharacterized protein n=1 Tax=Arundo donax TaxID=35708 RepID=A0A0A9BCT8_ARUDO
MAIIITTKVAYRFAIS